MLRKVSRLKASRLVKGASIENQNILLLKLIHLPLFSVLQVLYTESLLHTELV